MPHNGLDERIADFALIQITTDGRLNLPPTARTPANTNFDKRVYEELSSVFKARFEEKFPFESANGIAAELSKGHRAGVTCMLLRTGGIALLMSMFNLLAAHAQDEEDALSRYPMKVSVNEVTLTFHAADAQGLAVNNLHADEVKFLDDGKPPVKVLAFTAMTNVPIRAGILMDTSGSMDSRFPADRAIAIQYAQRLLRAETDQAFVMDFGYTLSMARGWTSDPAQLVSGLRGVSIGRESPLAGTALFDAVFRACSGLFGKINNAASGNFILLFSDGGDNASHLGRDAAVSACQRTNTVIYPVRRRGEPDTQTLTSMAEETGGRVIFGDGTELEIYADLRRIEADMRSLYRVLYRPQELKKNGAFHTVAVTGPERAPLITVRNGYYAPAR